MKPIELKLLLLSVLGLILPEPANAQWQKLTLTTSIPNGSYASIYFVSDSVGFLSGCDNPSSWNVKGLFKTSDAGNSWSAIKGGSGGDCKITHAFADKTIGYSITTYGSFQPNELLKTSDGGTTWHNPDTSNTARMGALSFTGAMHFVTGNLGFASKDDTVLKTTNGGKSWQAVHVSRSLNAFAFTSSQTGYAGGDKGLLKTTNGGSSWSVSDTTYNIRSLSFPSATTGYAVGTNGTILKTTDAGTTWLPQMAGISNTITLNSIFCPANHFCYAVGDAGTIVSTSDGGITWTQQNSGVNVNLNSVSCTASHCYAVGDTAVLLKTSGITGIATYGETSGDISLFPNPAQSEVIIKASTGFKNADVVIYNAQGIEVKRVGALYGKELRIAKGDLANGLYMVYIHQDTNMRSMHKVIFAD